MLLRGVIMNQSDSRVASPLDSEIDERALTTLKNTFRLNAFRPGQKQIIHDILSGRDTLAVLPTGSGKSLCYQLPGVLTHGLTLVISPLIALMKDQVDSLLRKEIPAAGLNSSISYAERQKILEDLSENRLKFLFVAPERLATQNFQALITHLQIGLLAIDEAHCISQWGHDFRPDYRCIGSLRASIGNPPTIALTATASPDVQHDIAQQLNLRNPALHILGFDRKNLLFSTRFFDTDTQKIEFIASFIDKTLQHSCEYHKPYKGGGIIYAATIPQAEKITQCLRQRGLSVGIYHAKLSGEMRSSIQERFMNDEYHCLVATTAFGMGVDKPDIRFVIHFSMSADIEAYTQESGRAGRDANPAICTLLFARSDIKIQHSFVENSHPDFEFYHWLFEQFARQTHSKLPQIDATIDSQKLAAETLHKNQGKLATALRKLRALGIIEHTGDGIFVWKDKSPKSTLMQLDRDSRAQAKSANKRLNAMVQYVYCEGCKTKYILEYFGSDDAKHYKSCHHCDGCGALPIFPQNGSTENFPPESNLYILLKCLSAVFRCQRLSCPYTHRQITSSLKGTATDPQLKSLSTFGLLQYLDEEEILIIFGKLIQSNVLLRNPNTKAMALSQLGIQLLRAKSLEDFPQSVAEYMKLRFKNDNPSSSPWKPQPSTTTP